MVNHHGHESTSGGLLLYNGGTVCDDKFSDNAAVVICKKMGHDGLNAGWSVMKNEEDDTAMWPEIQYSYDIKLDEVNCGGDDWADCYYDNLSNDCSHKEDVFLNCEEAAGIFCLVRHSLTALEFAPEAAIFSLIGH